MVLAIVYASKAAGDPHRDSSRTITRITSDTLTRHFGVQRRPVDVAALIARNASLSVDGNLTSGTFFRRHGRYRRTGSAGMPPGFLNGWSMRVLSMRLFLSLAVLWLFGMPANALSATELRFLAAGVERRAVLVNEAPQGEVRPVVIVLHGGRGSAEEMRQRTGFDDLAVSQGFSVVFAEGTKWGPGRHAWNTGYLQRRQVGQTDDVAYFDALIDLVIARHRADPSPGQSGEGMVTGI